MAIIALILQRNFWILLILILQNSTDKTIADFQIFEID